MIEVARGYRWYVPPWWDRLCYIPLWEHEAVEVAAIRRLFPSPPPLREMTFVDIGANTGFYSVQLAAHFTCVVAFEPDAENAALLAVNAALNGCANVCVLPVAAWKELAPVAILIANPGIPMQSRAHWKSRGELDAPGEADHGKHRRLGLPLDAVPIVAVRLIKIDVEGCGDRVLAGAAVTVARDRPLVQMEVHNEAERRALHDLLLPLGYRRIEVDGMSDERELWGPP